MRPPDPTPIYHITHWRNLANIVTRNGLLSCSRMRLLGMQYQDLARAGIQDVRAHTPVPCGPGGVLHDYVPFYFAPRSPMLYVINRNGPQYPDRQLPVVHLVSYAQDVYAANRPAVFTNGHAIMQVSDFFTDPADFAKIDWEVMASTWWNDTQQHPGRKCRRQAEFLVQNRFPWSLVREVAVHSQQVEREVRNAIEAAAHQPRIRIRPQWYY